MQRQVPAVLPVRHPSDSVHRQSVGHSCHATERQVSAVQLCRLPGSFTPASWPTKLWPRSSSTSAVACSELVLLVIMQFVLCSYDWWQAHDFRHHGRYGPERFAFYGVRSYSSAMLGLTVDTDVALVVVLAGWNPTYVQSCSLWCWCGTIATMSSQASGQTVKTFAVFPSC